MPSSFSHPAPIYCRLVASVGTGILVTIFACLPASAARKTGEPASPLTPYAGVWAPSVEQCRDPSTQIHQRLRFDAEENGVYDGRVPNIDCHIEKSKTYPTGMTADLICEIGQESPFSFRTDIAILRTGPRTLSLTNTFVDRKPETLDYVRCTSKDLQLAREGASNTTDGPQPGPHYILPPLREGEYYVGQAYPANYAERRTELLDAKSKALVRPAAEPCLHAFCQRYPEIRACYTDHCVGRWERADGATVDYVINPVDLTVLKTICRDTCGADEIRLPVR